MHLTHLPRQHYGEGCNHKLRQGHDNYEVCAPQAGDRNGALRHQKAYEREDRHRGALSPRRTWVKTECEHQRSTRYPEMHANQVYRPQTEERIEGGSVGPARPTDPPNHTRYDSYDEERPRYRHQLRPVTRCRHDC